jgi:ribonuclease P protein component
MKFRAIKENHLFGKAYAKGKRAVTSALVVYVLPDYAAKRLQMSDTRKQLKNRYGITVSTKVGGAVTRSRCRRIIREGLRSIEKRGTLKQGYLIVIAARSSAPKLKSYDIERNLDEAFEKLGMYEK